MTNPGSYGRMLLEKLAALSAHPMALPALFAAALVEASIFPLPPDVILIPMVLARPRKAFLTGAVCVAGSVAGAMIGYTIGATLFEGVGERLVSFFGAPAAFERVLSLYREHALWTLLVAGFTSIPFSVFTIAAGFHHTLGPLTLLAGAAMGRVVRFSLLVAVLVAGGPALRRLIENHLPALSAGVLLLVIAAFLLARFLT